MLSARDSRIDEEAIFDLEWHYEHRNRGRRSDNGLREGGKRCNQELLADKVAEYCSYSIRGNGNHGVNMCPRQVTLAKEIVEMYMPCVRTLAYDLLERGGVELLTMKGPKVISLRSYRDSITVGDLIGEGAIGLIKSLSDWDPSKLSAFSFLYKRVAFCMINNTARRMNETNLPVDKASIMKVMCAKAKSLDEAVENIMRKFPRLTKWQTLFYIKLVRNARYSFDSNAPNERDLNNSRGVVYDSLYVNGNPFNYPDRIVEQAEGKRKIAYFILEAIAADPIPCQRMYDFLVDGKELREIGKAQGVTPQAIQISCEKGSKEFLGQMGDHGCSSKDFSF